MLVAASVTQALGMLGHCVKGARALLFADLFFAAWLRQRIKLLRKILTGFFLTEILMKAGD
jgi:hypothetical protein